VKRGVEDTLAVVGVINYGGDRRPRAVGDSFPPARLRGVLGQVVVQHDGGVHVAFGVGERSNATDRLHSIGGRQVDIWCALPWPPVFARSLRQHGDRERGPEPDAVSAYRRGE
jgi:hypothetical protein